MDLLQLLTMLATTLPVKTNVAGMTANVPIADANIAGPRSQAFAGGDTNPATLLLALELMARQGQNIERFTGFNDFHHRKAKDKEGNPAGHAAGLKLDVTAKNSDPKKYDEITSTLQKILQERGMLVDDFVGPQRYATLDTSDVYVRNENRNPSVSKSGKKALPHVDAGFRSKEAAQRFLENSFIELDKDYTIKNPVESQRKYADFMQKVYGKK